MFYVKSSEIYGQGCSQLTKTQNMSKLLTETELFVIATFWGDKKIQNTYIIPFTTESPF